MSTGRCGRRHDAERGARVAQWWELRRHVPDAVRWIGITAGAWAVALTAFLVVSTPLLHEGQSGLEATAVCVLGGLLMASTMAVVTGIELSD